MGTYCCLVATSGLLRGVRGMNGAGPGWWGAASERGGGACRGAGQESITIAHPAMRIRAVSPMPARIASESLINIAQYAQHFKLVGQ